MFEKKRHKMLDVSEIIYKGYAVELKMFLFEMIRVFDIRIN